MTLTVEALTPMGEERFRQEGTLDLATIGTDAQRLKAVRDFGHGMGILIQAAGGDRLLLPEH
jgi:hypothetical protein